MSVKMGNRFLYISNVGSIQFQIEAYVCSWILQLVCEDHQDVFCKQANDILSLNMELVQSLFE